MQHEIGEHALLADGRTAALVDPDGNIAWLCWPRIDDPPRLLAILDDARGGEFSVRPAHPAARLVERAYLPRSLVLRTVWELDRARLIVHDALSWIGPPTLVRFARCEGDPLDVAVRFAPAVDLGRSAARLEVQGATVAGTGLVLRGDAAWSMAAGGGAAGAMTVAPDAPAALVLSSASDPPPPNAAGLIDSTASAWAGMLPAAAGDRPSPLAMRTLGPRLTGELLQLSAAVLLGLRQRGGGIVAAPTTSLPQWPGTSRTWDYRYCWLRDSSLAAMALVRLGLLEEAHGLGDFIGRVAGADGPLALVRVDGMPPPDEAVLDHLAGHRGAAPVRVGNAAAGQPQLDVAGEVIEMAASLARRGALPETLGRAVSRLAAWTAAHWREPDHGIWEIRGAPRRYTHSRLLAWYGLTTAAAMADAGLVAGDGDGWRRSAAAVRRAVLAGGGTAPLELHSGGGGADSALALVPLLGLLPPAHPRVAATLRLITSRLRRGSIIDRHDAPAGAREEPCAPFLFATHWVADALEGCGEDGGELFAGAAAARGTTGLFGEVASPDDGAPLGNYPQVQSHASFILAAGAKGSGGSP